MTKGKENAKSPKKRLPSKKSTSGPQDGGSKVKAKPKAKKKKIVKKKEKAVRPTTPIEVPTVQIEYEAKPEKGLKRKKAKAEAERFVREQSEKKKIRSMIIRPDASKEDGTKRGNKEPKKVLNFFYKTIRKLLNI